MTNNTPENGISPGTMVQTASNLGFSAVIQENMTRKIYRFMFYREYQS